jgi:xanthine dehydrogenase YagR molybdenum-binding subunit
MAAQRGEDPLDLRLRWDPNPRRQRLYRWAQGLDAWTNRDQAVSTGRYRRGLGVAAGTWYVFWDPHVQVQLDVAKGRITASTASQDMGNGTRSMLAWAVAGALDLPPEAIDVRLGDSRDVYGCMSAGSRTTCSVGPAALHAAEQLREALVDLAVDQGIRGELTDAGILPDGGGPVVTWAELLEGLPTSTFVGRRRRDDERAFLPFAASHTKIGRTLPGSIHLCEVEVDTVLGHVRATRAWVGVTSGRVMCPPVARSQMEGAVVQGLSYALYEQRLLDARTGRLLTHNLDDYRIAGIGDMPPIDVHFDEEGYEAVRGGAIGIGEIGTVGVTASVANAVFHATGKRPRRLPLTPQRMLEVLA